MLVALGFNPVTACVICLIGNAASPEFGAIGTPTLSAANTAFPTTITGAADASVFAQMLSEPTARLLIPLCVVSPFVIILLCGGTKAFKGCCRYYTCICIIICYSFLSCSHIVGPELCVVIGLWFASFVQSLWVENTRIFRKNICLSPKKKQQLPLISLR